LTDHPTWVGVFLGVIGFTALLQAAFVVGLAVASRTAHRRLREVEERLEPQLAAGLDKVARLTSAVSAASEQARVRAVRLDATAARLAADLGELVGTGRLTSKGWRASRRRTWPRGSPPLPRRAAARSSARWRS